MKGLAAIVFVTLAAPASAAGYKVVLTPPESLGHHRSELATLPLAGR